MTKRFLLPLLLLAGLTPAVLAQNRFSLRLASGTYELPAGIPTDIAPLPGEYFGGRSYRIVQFWHTPDQVTQYALKEAGLGLEAPLHSHAYFTSVPAGFDWKKVADVRSVSRLEPAQKLSKRLAANFFPDWVWQGDKVGLTVQWLPTATAEDVLSALAPLAAEALAPDPLTQTVVIYVTPSNVQALAAIPAVYAMDLCPPAPTKEEERARAMHRTNLVDREDNIGRKYNGTGISVGLYDDGLVGPHIDFTGRIDQALVGSNNDGTHGDMTGGIIAGAGNLNPRMRGMATGAFLHVFNYASNLPNNQNYHSNFDVSVFSVSYSDGCNAGYTSTTQKVDNEIYSNPNMMVVFSAGNTGDQDCDYGAGAGWGNITGGHKMAKNCIAAANLNVNEALEPSSSRGPAHDGRLKPDIAANGQGQFSTDPNNTYAEGGGTSAACPGIAGITAQLNHAYRALNGNAPAPSALLKACLLNTAHDMGQPGPDFRFGWGRVNAFRALTTLEQGRYTNGTITQGATNTHAITVPTGAIAMRVMLYWADPAASLLSNAALINDLDMTMQENGSSAVLRPWLLNYLPGSQNLAATTGIDSMNNVEQIELQQPAAGTYTVSINGKDVPQGPQEYYLVYEFIMDELVVTYPVGGEGFESGIRERIYWDAWGNTSTFTVEYSVNNGQSWTTISNSVAATARYIDWITPSTLINDQVKVRVRRGTAASVSPDFFAVMPVPRNITVLQVCPDSATIAWDNVSGAGGYEVYLLGEKYMDLVATVPDNFAIIALKDPSAARWVAVRAIGPNGGKGLRCNAVLQPGGLLDCQIYADMSAAAVLTPFGSLTDCHSLPTTAQIAVTNAGLDAQTGFTVFSQVGGGAPDSVLYAGTLQAGETDTVAIPMTGVFAPNTNVLVKAWTSLPGDELSLNDTVISTFRLISSTTVTLPYAQSFEGFTKCASTDSCEKVVCDLAESWSNDQNIAIDGHDWRTFSGATPSPNTGPGVDHTLGNSTGKYLYLEANNCYAKQANLTSPCIDLTQANSPQLSFWYHSTGFDMGSLALDVFDGAVWHTDVIPVISGNKSNVWYNRKVSLAPFTGKKITLRFRGMVGAGYRSDFALDDISVADLVGTDPGQILACYLAPNPTTGTTTLQWGGLSTGMLSVTLMDLTGKTLLTSRSAASIGQYSLDLQGIPAGMYLVQVKSEDGPQATLKLEVME